MALTPPFGSLFCMRKHLAAEPLASVFFKYEKFVHKWVAAMISRLYPKASAKYPIAEFLSSGRNILPSTGSASKGRIARRPFFQSKSCLS